MSKNEKILLVHNVLSTEDLQALTFECDSLRDIYSQNNLSLSNFGSAIDIFEDIPISDQDPSRTELDSYLKLRFSNSKLETSAQEKIRSVIFSKLPIILQSYFHHDKTFLFNESYIVKEPNSDYQFRWHRDADEQLLPFSDEFQHDTVYWSVWVPLDEVNSENGTISFLESTFIHSFMWNNEENCLLPSQSLSTSSTCTAPTECETNRRKRHCLREEREGGGGGDHHEEVVSEDSEDFEDPLSSLPSRPALLSPGSILLFGSRVWHCSPPNLSSLPRRVFYCQYSPLPILSREKLEEGEEKKPHYHDTPLSFAVPCQL